MGKRENCFVPVSAGRERDLVSSGRGFVGREARSAAKHEHRRVPDAGAWPVRSSAGFAHFRGGLTAGRV